jgi:predicted esterase
MRYLFSGWTFIISSWLLCVTATAQRQEQGDFIVENIAPLDQKLKEQLSHYLHARSAHFLDWFADDTVLIRTRFGESTQLHRVKIPLGMRSQLTFSSQPIEEGRAAPTAAAQNPEYVFLSQTETSETAQLFYQGSKPFPQLLTDGKASHFAPVWSLTGKRLVFSGDSSSGTGQDLYLQDLMPDAKPRLLLGGQRDRWRVLDWSSDEQKLLVQKIVSPFKNELYLVDAWSGVNNALAIGKGTFHIHAARFDADGRSIVLAIQRNSEPSQLQRFDPITTELQTIVSGNDAAAITEFDTSRDGRYLAYIRRELQFSRLVVRDLNSRRETPVSQLPQGRLASPRFARSGKRLAVTAESSREPADVYVYEVETQNLVRWTQSETGGIDTKQFIEPELARFPGWDRFGGKTRELSALVYRPVSAGPHPVLMYLPSANGTPFQNGFEPFIQFLVQQLKVAVVAVNIPERQSQQEAVKDIGAALVWLRLQREFNADRIMLFGQGYGGSLTLASLAAYGDRLRGGVSEAGLTHSSKLDNLEAIGKPVLLIQGLQDRISSVDKISTLIAVLRTKNVPISYLAAKTEGSGFKKKTSEEKYFQTIAAFITSLTQS